MFIECKKCKVLPVVANPSWPLTSLCTRLECPICKAATGEYHSLNVAILEWNTTNKLSRWEKIKKWFNRNGKF